MKPGIRHWREKKNSPRRRGDAEEGRSGDPVIGKAKPLTTKDTKEKKLLATGRQLLTQKTQNL